MGFNSITLRLGPGYKDRPSGAAWAGSGRGRSEVGEGLGMYWVSINYSKGRVEWGWGGPSRAG